MKQDHSEIVPEQYTGKAIDVISSVELDAENASRFYAVVRERLLEVNNWDDYAGEPSAKFQLTDSNGKDVFRKANKGDYFKIDIPGPGTRTGHGYDWVRIEDEETGFSENREWFAFRVRPATNPRNSEEDVAHFYSHDSTSTFMVERIEQTIRVKIADRNTTPNHNTSRVTDKVRDALVGTAGLIEFSKVQWKRLAEGLLR